MIEMLFNYLIDCLVTVWMRSNDASLIDEKCTHGEKMTIKCDVNVTLPSDIIKMTLKSRHARSMHQSYEMEHCDEQYIIKIVGKRLYLTDAVPLARFSVCFLIRFLFFFFCFSIFVHVSNSDIRRYSCSCRRRQ